MTTLFLTDESFLEHDTGPHHPESPARLKSIFNALEDSSFDSLKREAPENARLEHLLSVHPEHHVERIFSSVPTAGYGQVDPDTILSPGSKEAILKSAGSIIEAVDQVSNGLVANAFCAVRPPGHHAESSRAMGFCFFNNVAVGAFYARQKYGFEKVAVIDFDVHHGNGTQNIFWDDQNLFFASTHQYPLYPGTGSKDEKGAHNNIVNVPLPPGTSGHIFREAVAKEVMPALHAFEPDFILISAGFDAHQDDPLSSMGLTEVDFGWITQAILDVAEICCSGRVASILEGGYNLDALAASVSSHVTALQAS